MSVSLENISEPKSALRPLNFPLGLSALGLMAAIALALAVRFHHPRQNRDEVARVSSPDGDLQAVVYEMNADAKSSFAYQVGIAQQGKVHIVAYLTGAMRNERAYGVNVRWLDRDDLSVEYLGAQSKSVPANDVRIAGHTVHVALHDGVRDASALPGGMLFNQQQTQNAAD